MTAIRETGSGRASAAQGAPGGRAEAVLPAAEASPPEPARRTGAQIMCEALIREGVELIFGIPGGAIMPFYHALAGYRGRLHHVLCRHEQGAGHAAEGYARATGRVGVCVGTSGPGATNLVTPIADAWMDSTPLVAITGQVASHLLGKDAFQEVDITGITVPITKHNYLVTHAEDLPYVFRETFHGKGAFPETHPLSLGMPGMHGWVHVNRAIQECDVLLNVGGRFDDRVTGKASTFAPRAAVIHVDIDPSEIGKNVRVAVPIVGDARAVLRALLEEVPPRDTSAWLAHIRDVQS